MSSAQKAVTFDLDGVYFRPDSFQKFKERLPKGVSDAEQVNRVLYGSEQMMNFKKGLIAEEEYWEFVKKELGIKIPNEEIFGLLRDCYEVSPGVSELVNRVKAKGYKTCICSNNFLTRIRELNNKFGFLDNFDTVVLSYEVGVMKPDKKIFETLISRTGLPAKDILYADDDETKLAGAMTLGISGFVYTTIEDFSRRIDEF